MEEFNGRWYANTIDLEESTDISHEDFDFDNEQPEIPPNYDAELLLHYCVYDHRYYVINNDNEDLEAFANYKEALDYLIAKTVRNDSLEGK